jgi:UDP-N-acetylglucosamine 4,6-dehydratase
MMGGATFLLTGGSGFFARHFTRYLLDHTHPHAIRLYARSESKLAECDAQFQDHRVRTLVGDVRDGDRLRTALRGVDFVVHAAAMKRVDTCEAQPVECAATNILGTQLVAQACLHNGVQRAVFLSTDKAVDPCTTYGASKLFAERLWNASNVYAAGLDTRFSSTRYGNVIGSTGSVIERWKAGGREMSAATATRFWMTAHQACALVMQAFQRMQGGEVFLPKIRAASLKAISEAITSDPFVETGLRGSEKLHEALLTDEERTRTRDMGDCYVMLPAVSSWSAQPPQHQGVSVETPYRSDTVERYTQPELTEMIG